MKISRIDVIYVHIIKCKVIYFQYKPTRAFIFKSLMEKFVCSMKALQLYTMRVERNKLAIHNYGEQIPDRSEIIYGKFS